MTLSWFYGSLTFSTFIGALLLSSILQDNDEAKGKVQRLTTSILSLNIEIARKHPETEAILVDKELDKAIESFFKRIIKTFISSWYSSITHDETFVWNVKLEITEAIRNIAIRLKTVRLTQSTYIPTNSLFF